MDSFKSDSFRSNITLSDCKCKKNMEVLRFAPVLNYFGTVRTCCRGCLVVLVNFKKQREQS